jgi:pimeloyl-ACP methyl ester carboxylesterase
VLLSEGYITTDDEVRLYYQKVGSGSQTVIIPNGIYLLEDFMRFADGRTLIFYDVRNRGRSDSISDVSKLTRGVLQDVDDLDAVRRHFGIDRIDLIGHSYVGMTVGLYAMQHPDRVNRMVQIGPVQPDAVKKYPPDLAYADEVGPAVFSKLGQMQKEGMTGTPEEICRKFWAVLAALYVVDPADVEKVNWGRCDLTNESGFMRYWMGFLQPSIQKLQVSQEDAARMKAPVLVVHGTKDRNAAYGGGTDWALLWADARLLTVEDAAHVPWIEEPELVLGSISTFLEGAWPEEARRVTE